uniref:Variable lymphocyte receptor C n=1 Tax=Lampetra planeri TaxID=7750 RepID=L7YCJ7_LAMPL|nr:variable lymphocyte receptor C [Lampetra planeri]
MGFVVALLVLGAWCGSCSAQGRERACFAAGKDDLCTCSNKTESSPETVDCSSKKLTTVPTNPWDCECASIIYFVNWLKENPKHDSGASCEKPAGTAVKDVKTEPIKNVPCKHVYPTPKITASSPTPATPIFIPELNSTTNLNAIHEHRTHTDVCNMPFVTHMCLLFCNLFSTCSLCFIIKPLHRY